MNEARTRDLPSAIRRFEPYPAYKDSGVEWLGEIPVSWKVERADSFLRYDKTQIEPSEISDELVFHYSIPSIQETGDGQLEPPSGIDSAKLRIEGERLLVSKLNPRKGVVLIAAEQDVPTLCSTEFVPFEARSSDLRWAMYMFMAESTRQRLSAVVRSATRSHQRAEVPEIAKMWHGVPPLPEQRAIAAFLDRETAQIDSLIATKERLIELLQEKRTAVITRAVTKGLDPTAPMKDSGVEWLGEIPAHWAVKRIKNISRFVTSGSRGWAEHYVDEGAIFLRIGNLRTDSVDLDLSDVQHVSPPPGTEGGRTRVRAGDVVISITALIGAVGVVPAGMLTGFVNQHLALVRLSSEDSSPRWLAYCVLSRVGQEQLQGNLYGGTKDGLNLDDIRSTIVLMPAKGEQDRLIDTLDRNGTEVDALIAKVRIAIDRLKEFRTALISAAVTGKIDVREETV